MSQPKKRLSLYKFQERFSDEQKCRDFLFQKRWADGFVCPKCGSTHFCRLSNGLIQCNDCHHQTSVTAGTVMHGSHVPLTKWFLAMYYISTDKRGISAVMLQSLIGVTYKTAWSMLFRIRNAMGKRNKKYRLSGKIEFDDAFFGGATVGKKRGRGTEKTKVFVALSLDKKGNPRFLKVGIAKNIKAATVKHFAETNIKSDSTIHSDGYRSYIKGLYAFNHQPKVFDPENGLLHWIHIMIGNAKTFILGTYHGLPKKYLDMYLDEFCYRFNRRAFGENLIDRLAVAMVDCSVAYSKG